jgi:ribonuclease R
MNEDRLKSLILEHIRSLDKGRIRRRELYSRLGLKGLDYGEFKRVLDELEKSGELVRLKGRSFSLPEGAGLVTGEFVASRHGGGFVRPETGEPVYVRREDTAGALPGDTVRVRLTRRGHVGINRAGEVVAVVERSSRPIVGVYRKVGRTAYIIPRDMVHIENLLVTGGDALGARDGDIVVCRVERDAPAFSLPSCAVVEVLGDPGAPGVDVLIIARKHDLPIRFPDEVIEESLRVPPDLSEEVISKRKDIRGTVTFTIDPVDARDFDDAVSVARRKDGGWDIGVHIADVSHYIPDGSATDREACVRGMSCYLVDRVIPMLPERLSNELCSLRPEEDRLTKSVFAHLDREGNTISYEIADTAIHSRARLTYEQVQAYLDSSPERDGDGIPPEVGASLTVLSELTDILASRREKRGSIDFDIPEAKVVLDGAGFPVDIVKRPRLKAHRMIEEAMLLANTITASALAEAQAPFLYRVHDTPDGEKLEAYADIARALGHDFRASRTDDPFYLQEFLASIRGSRHERVLNMLLLRSMKKAAYSPMNVGHFGLALPVYAHFTSPIRRYPDLLMHRQIERYVLGNGRKQREHDLDFYKDLGNSITGREILTDAAERDSVKMKAAQFMETRLGEEYDGTISGIIPIGFFVELDDVFVEGLVHVSSLDDDYYEIDESGVAMVGRNRGRRFMIGDRVRVIVSRADKDRGEVDFVILEQPKERTNRVPKRAGTHSGKKSRRSR